MMAPSIPYGVQRQIRVFVALFYREGIGRFARRSLGLFEEVGSIVIHIAVFSAMRLYAGIEIHRGMKIVPFMATGVFTYWVFKSNITTICAYPTMATRYAAFPQVTPLDVALARGAVNTVLYLLITICSFWIFRIFDLSGPIRDLAGVLSLMSMASLFGIGCGLACGGLFAVAPVFRTMLSGILRILMYVSGVFFVIPELPYKLRYIALFNPLLHLNDLIRQAYFPIYDANQASMTYVVEWVLLSVVIGLIVERALRRLVLVPE